MVSTYLLAVLPYSFLLPFLGAFFGGEETIILISMLSATGAIGFQEVLFFVFLGTMLSDACWFLIGRRFLVYLGKRPRMNERFTMIAAFINRLTGRSHMLAMLVTKFLYGTRIIMLFYLGREKLSFPRFLSYNAVVTAIWTLAICWIGWLAGRGVINIIDTFDSVSYGLGFAVLAGIAFYSIRIWLNHTIIEDASQSS